MIRVLVVEDNIAFAEHCMYWLALAWGSENVQPTIRGNYQDAINVLDTTMVAYDLIHLDLNLSRRQHIIGDGIELIRQLADRPIHCHTPIIVVTGYAQEPDAVELDNALERIQFLDKLELSALTYIAAARRAIADPFGFMVATKKGLVPVTNYGPLEIRWHEYKCFWNDIFFRSTPAERQVLRELCCLDVGRPRPVPIERLTRYVSRGKFPKRVIETHISNISRQLQMAEVKNPPKFHWDNTNETWLMEFP